MSKFLDRFGREVKPGDRVAYAMTAGRSGVLALGTAIGSENGKLKWQRDARGVWKYRESCIKFSHNLVIITGLEEVAND
jgi:hypothetical protein